MYCIPICGPSIAEIQDQISSALIKGDLLEFRLDLFTNISIEEIGYFRKQLDKPVIFTLRKESQGGSFKGSEKERLEALYQFAELQPDYMDLEWDVPSDFIESIQKKFPQIQWILSSHHFSQMPDVSALLSTMEKMPAHFYKIACSARSTCEALRLLTLKQKVPLLSIAMGEWGVPTRILGPRYGAPWTFTSLSGGTKTAAGQLTIDEIQSIYGIERLTKTCEVYGLIGDPVDRSIGHLCHNHVMKNIGWDAVYIKMPVKVEELSDFFNLIKQLKFCGLSVTMPLKEQVLPFLDEIDEEAKAIGAVNTICVKNGRLMGYNTDGKGALDAIDEKIAIKGKRVVVLGAGGSARSIIHEALKRKAIVFVLNRTKEKALQLAHQFGVYGGGLNLLADLDYDVIINTTPDPCPIPLEHLRLKKVAMDIKTLPKTTLFLQAALEKECEIVYGVEMFVNQALGQYDRWAEDRFNKDLLKKLFCEEALRQAFQQPSS